MYNKHDQFKFKLLKSFVATSNSLTSGAFSALSTSGWDSGNGGSVWTIFLASRRFFDGLTSFSLHDASFAYPVYDFEGGWKASVGNNSTTVDNKHTGDVVDKYDSDHDDSFFENTVAVARICGDATDTTTFCSDTL